MTKRLNITAITFFTDAKGEQRKSYDVVGSAFVNETRDGAEVINLKFKYIPVAAPGEQLEIALFPPKAKDAQDGPDAN